LLKRGLADHENEVVGLVRDLLDSPAVRKLLTDEALAARSDWARNYYIKRYVTIQAEVAQLVAMQARAALIDPRVRPCRWTRLQPTLCRQGRCPSQGQVRVSLALDRPAAPFAIR